ncbi:MAG TPA: ATP-binding protein [Pyrinomonadaceae bacterium]|nr:ATP-binding protein [Pyrinomonadaceae bacterium]
MMLTSARGRSILVAACVVLTILALVISSLSIRLLLAVLVLLTAAVWAAITFFNRRADTNASRSVQLQDRSQSPESFAISSLFEATMGSMREGLLVVDKDMRVVASNRAAHRLFNPSLPRLDSQRLTELTRNPAIYSAFLDALQGVERSGVKVETHGPERQVFDLRVVPIGGNGKGPEGALGVFFDITRTERLELVRQEFLSNVSHELRTPLTAIIAFVETLETGALEDPESSQRFLSIIRKNASRMHGLIDDILELTAIEGGNVTLRAASVNLHELVSEVCASLAAKAATQGVSLVNEVAPEVMVHADSRRLEQMLTNLIDNGIKFSREGGTVAIRHDAGTRDRIFVEDNGDGIPAQHLERLFERFYRIDRARSRDMGGTGLGLAIVKHLALLHGGEVTVDSDLGKGTIFTIHLPKT